MSSSGQQKSTEETLTEFNTETEEFIEENKERILCMFAYSVSFEMQPYVASYQRYFNHDLISTFDAKTIYAYNLELPHFLNVYIILRKSGDNTHGEKTNEICRELVQKFTGQNEHVLAGLTAFFYDTKKMEKIDEYNFGDKDTLKEIKVIQS